MVTFSVARYSRTLVPGLLYVIAICGASHASAEMQGFCYIQETSMSDPYNGDGKPTYFTAIISATDSDHFMPGLFSQYIQKKYSPKYISPAYCTYLNNGNLEERIAYVKQHGGAAVMTGWTPDKHSALMAGLARNPPPPPVAAAQKAPPHPLAAQTAYEKALAAQRPQNVAQARLGAAAKKLASAPLPNHASTVPARSTGSAGTSTQNYQFCSSTGNPYHGTAQAHFYVTQIFPATAASPHPEGAFGVYLRNQHPQESNYASCTRPGPLSRVKSNHGTTIDNYRKSFPNRAVVELSWSPGPH